MHMDSVCHSMPLLYMDSKVPSSGHNLKKKKKRKKKKLNCHIDP